VPATVSDIARQLGVSTSTVADVLRGRPGYAQNTRQRVLDAAARLQYVPNYHVRSILTKRSCTVGIVGSIRVAQVMGQMFKPILDGLAARGYMPVFHDSQSDEEAVAQLRARRVDGILMLRTSLDDASLARLVQPDSPLVVVRALATQVCPCVQPAPAQAYQDGVNWLAQRGHRRIAFVGVGNASVVNRPQNTHWQKILGYTQAMQALGLFDPGLLVELPLEPGTRRQFVARNPDLFRSVTAILAGNDCIAIEVMSGLAELGLRVPADCSVMGFDNTDYAMAVTPRLTTFDPRYDEVGQAAVEMVLALMDGQAAPSQTFVPRLIERESVATRV
jgi:LacI family transcriptional regulator